MDQFQRDLNQLYDRVEMDIDKAMEDFNSKFELDFKQAEKEARKKLIDPNHSWSFQNPIWKDYNNFFTTVDNELTKISNKMKKPLSYSLKCISESYSFNHQKGEKFPGKCLICSGFWILYRDLSTSDRMKKIAEIKNDTEAIMKVYQNYMKKKELDFTTPDV